MRSDLAKATIHQLGPFRLDAKAELLFHDNEPVALGQRAVALLRVLVERAGAPVSKDALIAAAWAGLAVEESNLTVQIAALRRVLEEVSGGGQWIETLPRRGYRYVGPVVAIEEPGLATTAISLEKPAPLHSDKPSIAVLPFDNMSGDPEQEYFGDGIAEDIITALSRFRRLVVTARNSSFSYKSQGLDMVALGRELGVRYLLEGSVRRAGKRVRITAQLIEANSGNHIWADRYDRDLGGIFEVQDEITRHIAVAIEPAVTLAEIERAKRTRSGSISAWDCYLKALSHFHQVTSEENVLAMAELGKAIELDRGYVPALALLSLCHVYSFLHGWSISRSRTIQDAGRLAERAVSIDSSDPAANLALSWYCLYDNQLERGLLAARNAAEQEPNSFIAWCQVAALLAHLGRAKESCEVLQSVQQMSGRDPWRWWWYMNWGNAYFAGGQYDAAVDILLKGKELRPSWYGFYVILAASAASAGQLEVARQAAQELLKVLPRATMRGFRRHPAFAQQSAIDALLDGLRMAGVPEE
jgi:TolB-like protein